MNAQPHGAESDGLSAAGSDEFISSVSTTEGQPVRLRRHRVDTQDALTRAHTRIHTHTHITTTSYPHVTFTRTWRFVRIISYET